MTFLHCFKAAASSSASVKMNSFFSAQDIGPVGPDRNWKGIGISLLVILVVLSLIGLSIVLLSKGKFSYKLLRAGNADLFFCISLSVFDLSCDLVQLI